MKVCEICGKGLTFGCNVSHSMRHTNKKIGANLQKVEVEINGKKTKKLLCTNCIKTLKKEVK